MDNFKKIHNIETDITLQSKVENDHCLCFTMISGFKLVTRKTQTDFTDIIHSVNDTVAICAISLECSTQINIQESYI